MIKTLAKTALALVCLLFCLPFLVVLARSLNLEGTGLLASYRLHLSPEAPLFRRQFLNSFLYALAGSVGATLVAIPLALAITHLQNRFMRFFMWANVVMLFLPFQVTLLPNYILLDKLHLLDTPWALVLHGLFSPYPILLLAVFFRQALPPMRQLYALDSDALGPYILRVVLPGNRTGLLAVTALCFSNVWNALDAALIFIQTPEHMPLSVALLENGYDGLYAASVLYILPVLTVFAVLFFYLRQKESL